MSERKNIKVDGEVFGQLDSEKSKYETWNQLFRRLLEEAGDDQQVNAQGYAALERLRDEQNYGESLSDVSDRLREASGDG